MVVKMMRWRPWPPPLTRKYEVRVVVRRLDGFDSLGECRGNKLTVEIKWKGSKGPLSSLRRSTFKRNCTSDGEVVDENRVVVWDEEFQSLCSLSAYKENVFLPWEVSFSVVKGFNQGAKNRVPAIGAASLNLADYVNAHEQKEVEICLPLIPPMSSTAERSSFLIISLSFLELRTVLETPELVQRSIVPVQSPPQPGEVVLSGEKDELSALKAGLRKVKIFTEFVSTRKPKKACTEEECSEGSCSTGSKDAEYNFPFDSDSLDDFVEGETDEGKEDSSVRKSFSYGTLAYANYAGESFYSNMRINGGDEDWVYYSYRKSDVCSSHIEDLTPSVSDSSFLQSSKRGLLSWRKRKLSFRSPKAKGEPLLKKTYGEEGGDDIDHDRRQLSSDESLTLGWHNLEDNSSSNCSPISYFGDDNFAIGSWEQKEVISRDGGMKLHVQVFFASIDQRSERAAGESACTALVAVIADWFQNNRGLMPIKSQFDSLIREGSLEWRNLCENEMSRESFPDKHFDLETVLQAKVRPLSVVPGKSFIGFFHPDGIGEGRFDFLHGAMSFDNIWEEISQAELESSRDDAPNVYIVSWNDHFFVLKVEPEAYYIIDTLGERLYEGCNQAFILKFDRNTTICKIPNTLQSPDDKTGCDQQIMAEQKNQVVHQASTLKEECSVVEEISSKREEAMKEEEEVVCQGKESCKEYIKCFLAAIPIRELQADIKKGLMAETPLHHRLQIELHYTIFSRDSTNTLVTEENVL